MMRRTTIGWINRATVALMRVWDLRRATGPGAQIKFSSSQTPTFVEPFPRHLAADARPWSQTRITSRSFEETSKREHAGGDDGDDDDRQDRGGEPGTFANRAGSPAPPGTPALAATLGVLQEPDARLR